MARSLQQLFFDTANRIRFGAKAPVKNQIVWIDPASIEEAIDSASPDFQRAMLAGRFERIESASRAREARRLLRTNPQVVADTDFDRFTIPLEETETFKRMARRISGDLDWEEAGFYDWMMEGIARSGSLDGCRNREDVIARYQRLDVLEAHLRNGGTLSAPANSREIGDAIAVACNRFGKFVFCGKGNHRLALAWTLKSTMIPVAVCSVHKTAVESGAWESLLDRTIQP